MKTLFAALRLIAGLAGLGSIIATLLDTASRATINPFNFFGYFTMQSNILTMVAFLAGALATLSGRKQTEGLVLARVTSQVLSWWWV